MKVTDAELVQRLRHGDTEAFEEIVSRYTSKVFALSMGITKNRQDAEEVLQDTFVIVYRKINKFEGRSEFSSWLYRVAANTALLKVRGRKRHNCPEPLLSIDDAMHEIEAIQLQHSDGTLTGLEHMEQLAVRSILMHALEKLEAVSREIVILYLVRDMEIGTVADRLRLTIPAVKSRLARARAYLRSDLEGVA